MGRKKRSLDYVKPFCFYCDKIFPNQIILHQHQKSVHFTCPKCQKKFPSTHNLTNHFQKNHNKSTLTLIPNSLPERGNPQLNIFAMTGVPNAFIEQRMHHLAQKYWKSVIDTSKENNLNNRKKIIEKNLKQ